MIDEDDTIPSGDSEERQKVPKYDDFARRFRQACKEANIKTTQRALGHFFDVSEITARNWWHGEKMPGMNNARKAAGKLKVNTEWLISGKGLKRTGATEIYGDNVAPPSRPPVKWAPVVSWAHAGEWAEVWDAYEPGDADAWFPIPPGVRCNESSYWTEVQGNSMINTTGGESYPPGTLILIDPEVRLLATGALVLARLDGSHRVTFKRLSVEGDRCFLEPLNTQYSVIELECPAQVIGTMKAAVLVR